MRLNAREAVVKISTPAVGRLPITMPASGLRLKCVACFRLRQSQVPQRCANFYVTEFTRRTASTLLEVDVQTSHRGNYIHKQGNQTSGRWYGQR